MISSDPDRGRFDDWNVDCGFDGDDGGVDRRRHCYHGVGIGSGRRHVVSSSCSAEMRRTVTSTVILSENDGRVIVRTTSTPRR